MITPVIMAGGSGTRLWPLSRSQHPKQFVNMLGTDTLLQQTVERLCGLPTNEPIVICNEDHRFLVAEQLRAIDCASKIILEPVARNTAPAIALAALSCPPETLLLVLAADHMIRNEQMFREVVSASMPIVEENCLVTFGITPTEPHTGYGYVELGDPSSCGFKVKSFREKPDADSAQKYIQEGRYLWNSGMFMFRAGAYLDELKKYRFDIYQACNLAAQVLQEESDFTRVDAEAFSLCPSESIDFAVMESTANALVVPLAAEWSDVGSWASMWSVGDKDAKGNVTHGDVILEGTANSLVRSDDKLVAALGLENAIIVSTKDAVLVTNRASAEEIKVIVQRMESEGRAEASNHRKVQRPWGTFDSLELGVGYQVKRICVNPAAKLSLQMHHHRSEHWVVVNGTAQVTNGNRTFVMKANESTFIPAKTKHCLENIGVDQLEIIEVQCGPYLGEDDIVRFSDDYGRV